MLRCKKKRVNPPPDPPEPEPELEWENFNLKMPTELREANPWTDNELEVSIDTLNTWSYHKVMLLAYQEIGGVVYFREIGTDEENQDPTNVRVKVDKRYPVHLVPYEGNYPEILQNECDQESRQYVKYAADFVELKSASGVSYGIVHTLNHPEGTEYEADELILESLQKDDNFTALAAITPKYSVTVDAESYGEGFEIETEFYPLTIVYAGSYARNEDDDETTEKSLFIYRSDRQIMGRPKKYIMRNPADGTKEHVIAAVSLFESVEGQESVTLTSSVF